MKRCKSPKEFEQHIRKELNLFLVPCCYLKNGKFNNNKLGKRIATLKKVEAQMLIRIRSLELIYKSTKD